MAVQQINSKAFVIGVTKEKVLKDLYTLFYHIITANVTDPSNIHRDYWWFPSWPDWDVENKDSYPIGMINSPDISWTKKTLTRKWVPGVIDLEISSTQMKELDNVACQVIEAIETHRDLCRDVKVKFVNLDATSTDHVIRDKITVHYKTLTFSFKYQFTKSS